MLADMATELDAARLLTLARGDDEGRRASATRWRAPRPSSTRPRWRRASRTRRSRSTAATATRPSSRSSATTATRASPRSTRARARSSASSSPRAFSEHERDRHIEDDPCVPLSARSFVLRSARRVRRQPCRRRSDEPGRRSSRRAARAGAEAPDVEQELGSIDQRAVEKTFTELQTASSRTATRRARDRVEYLTGDVKVFFRVGGDGRREVFGYFEDSTLGDRETEKCILGVFAAPTGRSPKAARPRCAAASAGAARRRARAHDVGVRQGDDAPSKPQGRRRRHREVQERASRASSASRRTSSRARRRGARRKGHVRRTRSTQKAAPRRGLEEGRQAGPTRGQGRRTRRQVQGDRRGAAEQGRCGQDRLHRRRAEGLEPPEPR